METPNVNNLNGVPNFGHGFPEALSELPVTNMDENEEKVEGEDVKADVPADEGEAETVNG